MARARHKHVLHTRKSLRRRRMIRLGLPVGAALALANPAAGLVWPEEQPVRAVPVIRSAAVTVRPSPVPMRVAPLTRAEERVRLVEKAPQVTNHKFAETPLNVRVEPAEGAKVVDVLEWAEKVGVTGEDVGRWAEVVLDKEAYWVNGAYLAERKPRREPEEKPTPSASPDPSPTSEPSPTPTEASSSPATNGVSTAACATGSAVETGLSQNAVDVHRAVCAAFPEVESYGGLRPGDSGEHGSGHALDIMTTGATGDRIAEWVRAHASELGASEVIWQQRIWTVQRSSEGWRAMEDRGSVTANHYDHVHVTVY